MNDERLAELKKVYADRNLMEELSWAVYANHSGCVSKTRGEFMNWLCLRAYNELKQAQRTGKWIEKSTGGEHFWCCSECGYVEWDAPNNYCPNCGADMRGEKDG